MTDDHTQPGQTRAARTRAAARERREHEKRELRQAILETAGRLFVAHGYDGFSLRQVAEQVGYSPATIYLYFKDKDDLLFTVVDEGCSRFWVALRTAADSVQDPWERLAELGRAYVRFGLTHPVHYQLMFMQRADFLLDSRPNESEPRINSFGVLQDAVRAAIEAGVVCSTDVDLVSATLWAVVHGIVALSISMPFIDEARILQMSDLAGRMMHHGLAQ